MKSNVVIIIALLCIGYILIHDARGQSGAQDFECYMSRWTSIIPSLVQVLKQWDENRPVVKDLDPAQAMEKWKQSHPLQIDAEFRRQFNDITSEMASVYVKARDEERKKIRTLLKENKRFRDVLEVNIDSSRIRSKSDEPLFYSALVFASIADQGIDARDFLLCLDRLNKAARNAGIVIRPHLEEVAALSSDMDPFGGHGFGSTRELLLKMSWKE
jgi:hypothetical protein